MNSLVIDMPSLQTIRRRYASTLITFVFWIFWFYLWIPLISLVAWILGIDLFYDRMIVMGGFDEFVDRLHIYILTIVIMGALLVIWGVYNMRRFRGKERRTRAYPVDISMTANYFIVNPVELTEWQQSKNLIIHIDDLGMIQSVEKRMLAPPGNYSV